MRFDEGDLNPALPIEVLLNGVLDLVDADPVLPGRQALLAHAQRPLRLTEQWKKMLL